LETNPGRQHQKSRGHDTRIKRIRPWFTGLLLLVYWARLALAQDTNAHPYPRLEVFAGYSAIETNDHTFQFLDIGPVSHLDFDERSKGFETAVIANLSRYVGIMGDFSAHFSLNQFPVPVAPPCAQPPCSSSAQPGTINPRLFTFLTGPELKARNRTRITPFVHALFGIAHSAATFNTAGSVVSLSRTDQENGFAMAFGGGFDVRILRRVVFRGFLTYSQAFVGSDVLARQRVNSVGWSSGVLFH
jgi:hypothetical protein